MFTNDSTENLLDNLENELTEVIEWDNPAQIQDVVPTDKSEMPPVPARRNIIETPNQHLEVNVIPVPVARRLQSLDKNEKNDENEIIQLSSVSSSSVSENQRNISQKTVVTPEKKPRKGKAPNTNILVVQEADPVQDEEKFFVTKHGKWAQNGKEVELANLTPSITPRAVKPKPHLEIVTEKPKKSPKNSKSNTSTSASQTSFESSSESSSSEESLKPVKKLKASRNKDKKKKKIKASDETSTESSAQKTDRKSTEPSQAFGVYLHSTCALKYEVNLKSLRVNISLYNEDSGKQIGESLCSKPGDLNNEFHNFICKWNEMLVVCQDIKRLQEIHNNVLLFFEVVNSEDEIVFWAFLKLFSQSFANVDDKFKLQLFKHQKVNQKDFFVNFCRKKAQKHMNIFEQWRLVKRNKFPAFMDITIKTLNQKQENAAVKEIPADDKKLSVETFLRKWQKLPGQPCKIPNKVFHKTQFHEKGSMNVKFSCDGNYIAYTEVTKDGSVLHIQKFPEMQEEFKMLEHSELIHDIDWLKQKHIIEGRQRMVTASSDFTAIVWKLETSSYTYNILPHPSFVYASKFLQSDDLSKIQVVTAGRDCIVRIWQNRKKLEGFELIQELKHPNVTKSSYITTIATRNAETFYTSSSEGDIVEWTLQTTKDYHLNRCLKLDGIFGHIVTNVELHPRGNKIFIRVQDFVNSDVTGTIFVLGVPTGLITQRYQQQTVVNESQGKLRLTTCGTHLFASNGKAVRFYSLLNGNLSSVKMNTMNIKISASDKITSMDYHPKDFYFACSIYGRNGGIVVCHFASETEEKYRFDKLKVDSNQNMQSFQAIKSDGTHFTDIIRKLDEVFLAPIDSEVPRNRETISPNDDETFTVDSKRSRTYTVSQGPATYTIQRSQNNTYEIQRKDDSDEDTTITESFN